MEFVFAVERGKRIRDLREVRPDVVDLVAGAEDRIRSDKASQSDLDLVGPCRSLCGRRLCRIAVRRWRGVSGRYGLLGLRRLDLFGLLLRLRYFLLQRLELLLQLLGLPLQPLYLFRIRQRLRRGRLKRQ